MIMKFKKILSFILVIVMIVTVLHITTFAASSGTCGENLTWTLDNNGVLTISGEGDMKDFSVSGASNIPWSYVKVNKIVIEEGVTSIGAYSFWRCSNVKSVSIPDSITIIGSNAFNECSYLKTVTFGENSRLQTLGTSAFANCYELTDINLPDSLINVSYRAFYYCKKLAEISLPDNIVTIDSDVFSGTAYYNNDANWEKKVLYIGQYLIYSYRSIAGDLVIKDGTKLIATSAFNDCSSLKSVYIPESVEIIGISAFADCSLLTTVTFAENSRLRILEENAFHSCSVLSSIKIPSGITILDSGVFWGCNNLEYITIPESVTEIGYACFYPPASLKDVYYEGDENSWDNIVIDTRQNHGLNGAEIHYNSCFSNEDFNHHYVSEVKVPATHLEDGIMISNCNCGDTYATKIDRITDHSYAAVITSPTCTESGFTTYTCVCGDEYVSDETDALGHNWSAENKCEHCGELIGDLDNNGCVDSNDAIILLYYTLIPDRYEIVQNCDFNGDGQFNSNDAIYLLYYTMLPERYPLT